MERQKSMIQEKQKNNQGDSSKERYKNGQLQNSVRREAGYTTCCLDSLKIGAVTANTQLPKGEYSIGQYAFHTDETNKYQLLGVGVLGCASLRILSLKNNRIDAGSDHLIAMAKTMPRLTEINLLRKGEVQSRVICLEQTEGESSESIWYLKHLENNEYLIFTQNQNEPMVKGVSECVLQPYNETDRKNEKEQKNMFRWMFVKEKWGDKIAVRIHNRFFPGLICCNIAGEIDMYSKKYYQQQIQDGKMQEESYLWHIEPVQKNQ